MKAKNLIDYRLTLPNGILIQAVVWELDSPVPPSTHLYKYRLVAIKDGERVLGFDNERGKGDHMHQGKKETPYRFSTVDQLMDDFLTAIKELK